jgi:hypothetical protein
MVPSCAARTGEEKESGGAFVDLALRNGGIREKDDVNELPERNGRLVFEQAGEGLVTKKLQVLQDAERRPPPGCDWSGFNLSSLPLCLWHANFFPLQHKHRIVQDIHGHVEIPS